MLSLSLSFLMNERYSFVLAPTIQRSIIALATLKILTHQTIITTSMIKLNRASCKIIKKRYARPSINIIAMTQYKTCRQQLTCLLLGWSCSGNEWRALSNSSKTSLLYKWFMIFSRSTGSITNFPYSLLHCRTLLIRDEIGLSPISLWAPLSLFCPVMSS